MNHQIIKLRTHKSTVSPFTDLPNILENIYLNRGISEQSQLDYGLDKLPSPSLMKSNTEAGKLLAEAIIRQDRLLIVADFDVDGATSCTLMLLALRSMGAKNVDYLVPDRFKFGYGLTPEIVDVAAQLSPDLIITVDNGIASIDGVDRANELSIKVLITDHHLPGRNLPKALAIVNPNQAGCTFPTKALAGVGVAFYLMLSLRKALRELQWFENSKLQEPNLTQFLDLVALGTVADIVPLEHCNRLLIVHGMKRIRAGKCRPGIKALLQIANKDFSRIQTNDLGFAVGPRLNAAGRLDDMSLGIECLLSDSVSKAAQLAEELDNLNKERREIQTTMQQQALNSLDKLSLESEKSNYGICLYQPKWHQGIIGLLASKIKDKAYRPTIVFANADNYLNEVNSNKASSSQEELLKGSARSIPGLHIRDILDRLATENPHLLNKFGGHAMAAGMTIRKSDLKAFSKAFNLLVKDEMEDESLENIIWSDGELSSEVISLDLAKMLRDAGPWGQAFEEPRFHGDFSVLSQRVLSGKHLKLELDNKTGPAFSAIAFFQDESILHAHLNKVRLVYKIDVNFFREQEHLQLMIDEIFID
jgi:single-stranded-DNA-specific exonuclease